MMGGYPPREPGAASPPCQVVHDAVPIKELDLTQTIFAVLGRETNVEILLEAAGLMPFILNAQPDLMAPKQPSFPKIGYSVFGVMQASLVSPGVGKSQSAQKLELVRAVDSGKLASLATYHILDMRKLPLDAATPNSRLEDVAGSYQGYKDLVKAASSEGAGLVEVGRHGRRFTKFWDFCVVQGW